LKEFLLFMLFMVLHDYYPMKEAIKITGAINPFTTSDPFVLLAYIIAFMPGMLISTVVVKAIYSYDDEDERYRFKTCLRIFLIIFLTVLYVEKAGIILSLVYADTVLFFILLFRLERFFKRH